MGGCLSSQPGKFAVDRGLDKPAASAAEACIASPVPKLSVLEEAANSLRQRKLFLKGSRASSYRARSPTQSSKASRVHSFKVVAEPDDSKWVLRRTGDINEVYQLTDELGRGNFGVVQVAVDRDTGAQYACKTLSKACLAWKDTKDVRKEVEILHHLAGHQNVIELECVFEDKDNLYLILELCRGGDLFDRIIATGKHSERQAAELLRTVLKTLSYCHSMGVFHRDIKPENFILTDSSESAEMKLIDFGLSVFCSEGQLYDELVGTSYYVAPEVLCKRYGKEADIWSCGVILHILLAGYAPFDGNNDEEILQAVRQKQLDFTYDPIWKHISPEALHVLQSMLARDPAARPSADQLLDLPWLSNDPTSSTAPNTPLPPVVMQRLQKFAAMNSFKKEARKVVATLMHEEEVVGLMAQFRQLDLDQNGLVSVRELQVALRMKGMRLPEKDVRMLIDRSDLNGDGMIDYEEFLGATISMAGRGGNRGELLMKAFRHFDTDDSGHITLDELRTALMHHKGFSEADLAALLAEVDLDADGRINYQEFCVMLRRSDKGNGDLLFGQQPAAIQCSPKKLASKFELSPITGYGAEIDDWSERSTPAFYPCMMTAASPTSHVQNSHSLVSGMFGGLTSSGMMGTGASTSINLDLSPRAPSLTSRASGLHAMATLAAPDGHRSGSNSVTARGSSQMAEQMSSGTFVSVLTSERGSSSQVHPVVLVPSVTFERTHTSPCEVVHNLLQDSTHEAYLTRREGSVSRKGTRSVKGQNASKDVKVLSGVSRNVGSATNSPQASHVEDGTGWGAAREHKPCW